MRDRLADLFDSRRYKLTVPSGVRWATTPSLWSMLTDAAARSWSAAGGGFGSRVPIATSAIDLAEEITRTAGMHARRTGRSEFLPMRVPDARGSARYVDLRVRRAVTAWYVDPSTTAADEILDDWISRATEITAQRPERPANVYGLACPDCGQKWRTDTDDQGDEVKHTALHVTWTAPPHQSSEYISDRDWLVRSVECRACGRAWFRGADLDLLTDRMLRLATTAETLSLDASAAPN